MKINTINIYRKVNKLTLIELARKIEMTEASLSRIENGIQGLTDKTAKKLESLTGIPFLSWKYPEHFPHPFFERTESHEWQK